MNRLYRIRGARHNLNALNGAPSGGRAINQKPCVDAVYGGRLAITGSVTVNGLQAQKRVMLLDRKTGQVVRATVSAADGSYAFSHLRAGVYCVLSFDDDASTLFNARVADGIEPD